MTHEKRRNGFDATMSSLPGRPPSWYLRTSRSPMIVYSPFESPAAALAGGRRVASWTAGGGVTRDGRLVSTLNVRQVHYVNVNGVGDLDHPGNPLGPDMTLPESASPA
jgi:hypothetical protein